jgi:hypothetical protein
MVYNGECKECNYECEAMHFQQNFKNWTSGNKYIDKFIQDTQLSAHDNKQEALEWIPYDRLCNIKHIEKIGVYSANWIDGCICIWSNINQKWTRINENMIVTLKSLNDPKNVTLEFTNEV